MVSTLCFAKVDRMQHVCSSPAPSVQIKPNSITLSSVLADRRPVCDEIPLHHPACDKLAIRFGTSSRAGRRPACARRVHVAGQIIYAVQLASRSETSSRPNSITLSSLWPAHELVAEQDSVMEYGLNWSATRFKLSRHVEIAWTCLRRVGNHVCDLDSVMGFSHSMSQTSSRTSSRARSWAR